MARGSTSRGRRGGFADRLEQGSPVVRMKVRQGRRGAEGGWKPGACRSAKQPLVKEAVGGEAGQATGAEIVGSHRDQGRHQRFATLDVMIVGDGLADRFEPLVDVLLRPDQVAFPGVAGPRRTAPRLRKPMSSERRI